MNSDTKELFENRIHSKKFFEIFQDMAKTLTSESIETFYNDNELRDTPLSFKEINTYVSTLNDRLIKQADNIRQDYKAQTGKSSPKLTRGCKKVISICMKEYIHALEVLHSSRQHSVKVKSYPQEVA